MIITFKYLILPKKTYSKVFGVRMFWIYTTCIDQVSRLELEYEIQKKIIHAAVRLAKEKGMNKNIKKERHAAVQRAQVPVPIFIVLILLLSLSRSLLFLYLLS